MTSVQEFTPPDSEWIELRQFGSPKAAHKFVKRLEHHHPELYGPKALDSHRRYLLVEEVNV